jgi:hypothetical protein
VRTGPSLVRVARDPGLTRPLIGWTELHGPVWRGVPWKGHAARAIMRDEPFGAAVVPALVCLNRTISALALQVASMTMAFIVPTYSGHAER